jgi:quinol monooxygenase YgiN
LYQDIEDPNALTLVEEWESRTDLDKHIRSSEYKKVLAAMDLSDQPPEIKFNDILKTDGMELIEEVLAKQC